jgi:hypothetical protein
VLDELGQLDEWILRAATRLVQFQKLAELWTKLVQLVVESARK